MRIENLPVPLMDSLNAVDAGAEYTEAMGAAEEPLPLNLHEVGGSLLDKYQLAVMLVADKVASPSVCARHCGPGF